jgi:hypothetical protein
VKTSNLTASVSIFIIIVTITTIIWCHPKRLGSGNAVNLGRNPVRISAVFYSDWGFPQSVKVNAGIALVLKKIITPPSTFMRIHHSRFFPSCTMLYNLCIGKACFHKLRINHRTTVIIIIIWYYE